MGVSLETTTGGSRLEIIGAIIFTCYRSSWEPYGNNVKIYDIKIYKMMK